MNISTRTLLKIASIGGFATVSMGLLAKWKISNNLNRTETFKEVLNSVKTHSEAAKILGEPIKLGSVDVENNVKNFVKESEARFEVPIMGINQKGHVIFWANKVDDKWVVPRIELELQGKQNNRIIIRN